MLLVYTSQQVAFYYPSFFFQVVVITAIKLASPGCFACERHTPKCPRHST